MNESEKSRKEFEKISKELNSRCLELENELANEKQRRNNEIAALAQQLTISFTQQLTATNQQINSLKSELLIVSTQNKNFKDSISKYQEEFKKYQEEMKNKFIGSKILNDQQKETLSKFIGLNFEIKNLLWQGSRDGFSSKTFHSLCDNKGPTITIIKSSNGFIFGGFTLISWNSTSKWTEDSSSFIFSLTNPNGTEPRKFDKKGTQPNKTMDRHLVKVLMFMLQIILIQPITKSYKSKSFL